MLLLKLATPAWVLVLVLDVAGCAEPAPPATAHSAHGSVVTSFELNCVSLEAETAFLRALQFGVTAQRTLEQPAFAQLLGLPAARAKQAELTLGEQRIELREFSEPKGSAAQPEHANDLGFEHLAIVVRDLGAAHARLLQIGAQLVSLSPQTLPASNPVAAGIRAEYFRDPSGHFMELIQFPPDKGDAAWHRASDSLFLGIDHSAIAVHQTAASLRFYRDLLGLQVKSESLNEGAEQAALSHVSGARVHITSLRGEHGPGVELLEYLAPPGGAPFPAAIAADAAHWEIAIRVAQLTSTLAALRAAGFAAPERGVLVSAVLPGELEAALVRDPDGHTVRLFEGAP